MELPEVEVPALTGGEGRYRIEVSQDDRASVLVVDDKPSKAAALAAIIADMGLEVVAVHSGREALRRLLARDFALILLDVRMPTMDGYETAQLIHSRPRSACTPIIFVTAETFTDEDYRRGFTAGAVDWVFSPIVPEILKAKVGIFVDLFHLTQIARRQAQELATRAEEIAQKNLQLQLASKMKSEFLANMSHELRSPLNAIIGFAEALKDGLVGRLEEEQADYIGEIFNSGTHLLSLINDILDLSKIEAGRMELELEPVAVAELLRASLGIIREKALNNRITLDLDLGGAPAGIIADARKMKQMVYNLLSNAMKFTPEGGQVTVSARSVQRGALHLAAPAGMAIRQLPLPDGEWQEFIEIAVRDSGIGIAADDLERLFQDFLQLDSSLARHYEGSGLGLALVRRLAALHGGTVAVASAPGKGSCFAVWVPCRVAVEVDLAVLPSPLVEAPLPPQDVPPAPPASRLALVIEDDDGAAELLRLNLEAAGFRVMRAPDGERGLMMAAGERPDLITLDMLLPGMDGWQVLECLQADAALREVPVVISTVVDLSERTGFTLGAARVLQKPVRRAALLAAVRSLGLGGKGHATFTVLAADSDAGELQIVSANFARMKNCTLVCVGTGQEAIDRARRQPPDLIILDVLLSDLSGFDVVQALKADPATAAVPILLVTAKALTAAQRKRLNGDAVKVVRKSGLAPDQFLAEVQRAMGE